jgi:hypothetical protein
MSCNENDTSAKMDPRRYQDAIGHQQQTRPPAEREQAAYENKKLNREERAWGSSALTEHEQSGAPPMRSMMDVLTEQRDALDQQIVRQAQIISDLRVEVVKLRRTIDLHHKRVAALSTALADLLTT